MYVLFVSACERKAVRRSRAILDSYALRVGERVWLSPMTVEGLEEVRSALSRSATRQTAVACYRNDGRRRMKLLWIVGARGKFGPEGHFPAGRRRAVAPVAVPDWVRHACLMAELAGLLHDLGKYSRRFQEKLRGHVAQMDAVRHEWLSLKLWQRVRSGETWEEAWKKLEDGLHDVVLGERKICNASLYGPSSARECADALIATHHGLFSGNLPGAAGRLVRNTPGFFDRTLLTAWNDPELLFWQRALRLDARLSAATEGMEGQNWTVYWRAVSLYARAALVLADHTVSALKCMPGPDTDSAFANTSTTGLPSGGRQLNQRLVDHLIQVSERAAATVWRMADLVKNPNASLPGLQPCALESLLRQADSESRFAWQNVAAEALSEARETYPEFGCLVFNMAGTGSGKTRMNVRAACILSREIAPRISIALNLRTLTLQTGQALQEQTGLSGNDLATIIGDDVTRILFAAAGARNAAAHSANWYDDDGNPVEPEPIAVGGVWPLPAWLRTFFTTVQERRILGAPVLVSTIDYLIAAGEPHRQGHHVKALLRLMSSDLILDEIDSYEPEALVAVLRLVQWSALFGRNVLCSSATLSRPVVRAVQAAYTSGAEMALRLKLGKNCETDLNETQTPLYFMAVIDDMLDPLVKAVPCVPKERRLEREDSLNGLYVERLTRQLERLACAPVYRLAELLPMSEASVSVWLDTVTEGVRNLHARYGIRDERSGVRYSFGLVRVANIRTAVDTARHLAKAFPYARVACYHANDWRISRFSKEQRLDFLLSRSAGEAHITTDPEIRTLLDTAAREQRTDLPFIVVATPVEEIGRDHDFDWAVIDVSSAQSLVQAAGRVNRHRLRPCGDSPNIAVPRFNWRHCRNMEQGSPRRPAFCWPGYEREGRGKTYPHDLERILPWKNGRLVITAGVRLGESCELAVLDDRGTSERLAFFELEKDAASFVADPVSAILLGEEIYEKTPLRSHAGNPENWRLRHDEEDLETVYEAFVYQGKDRGREGLWVERDASSFRVVEALPNAWLWLDTDAMRDRCAALGVDAERAMAAELVAYGKEGFWEYDVGFGMVRRHVEE